MPARQPVQERETPDLLYIDIVITPPPARDRLVQRAQSEFISDAQAHQMMTVHRLDVDPGHGSSVLLGRHEWCRGTIKLLRVSAYGWVLACNGGCNLRVPLPGRPKTLRDLRDNMLADLQDKPAADPAPPADG